MDRVDRLGWTESFSIKSYGMTVGIRANDKAVLDHVREVLPGKWQPTDLKAVDRIYSIVGSGLNGQTSSRRFIHLYSDDLRLIRSRDLESVMAAFDSAFRLFVAEFAKRHVFVHAGAVGWKGQAILIPGRSFSGKSTMVAELVRAGATYYSDEYAVIDSRGRLHPFVKPLELREEGTSQQSKFNIDEIGGVAGTKPLPVKLVLMTRFKEGARWRPRKLSSGQGVLQMLFNTVSARRNPERALESLERVAANADVLQGPRGEASQVVPAIIARLEKRLR